MARQTVRVEGLRELDRALGGLPRSAAAAVLRKALLAAGEVVAEDAEAAAPKLTGALERSIGVGTRLTRRQKAAHRKATRGDSKAFAEAFIGVGRSLPQGHLREFGGDGAPPEPFLRPAWDRNRARVLRIFQRELREQIFKAVRRLARKAARQAGGR